MLLPEDLQGCPESVLFQRLKRSGKREWLPQAKLFINNILQPNSLRLTLEGE
jgi:hypothetical protein